MLPHGKLLQYTLLAQDGFNASSLSWLTQNSYSLVSIIYKDSRLTTFTGIRSLANSSLTIRSLNYSSNRITYTTNLPASGIDYHKSFQVVFSAAIYSLQGVVYSNYSSVFEVNQRPELLKEYYSYSVRNYYQFFALPFLILMTFLFLMQVKGVYSVYIEVYRVMQTLALLLYSSYPLGAYTYYFLVGCSYCNFDFIPNVYALLAKSDQGQVFASYLFSSSDMDFVRLMGSILIFGSFMLCVYLICRFLV